MMGGGHAGYEAGDPRQVPRYVPVHKRVPGSEGVEPTDEDDNLLGDRATGGGGEGGVELHFPVPPSPLYRDTQDSTTRIRN